LRLGIRDSVVDELIQAGYRYACALQNDPGEAKGLVHDAWIRASRSTSGTPDKAYLLQCVRNLHIDQYRRAQKVVLQSVDDLGREAADIAGANDVAEVPDLQLQQALVTLRDVEREVLFLSVVEGYTAAEIADLTNSNRGTVLSLLHRARIKLKTFMQDDKVTPINRDIEGMSS